MKLKWITVPLLLAFSAYAEVAKPVPRMNDEYDPAKWPKATLQLSQAATLKDVFDSGLRPYRFPGLENTTLEVKHLNLMIRTFGKQASLDPG